MSCKKKRPKNGPGPLLPVVCAAFGAGILLAFLSVKLVLVLAAIFLVVLGVLASNC